VKIMGSAKICVLSFYVEHRRYLNMYKYKKSSLDISPYKEKNLPF
jgi:hypothetical protein